MRAAAAWDLAADAMKLGNAVRVRELMPFLTFADRRIMQKRLNAAEGKDSHPGGVSRPFSSDPSADPSSDR